MSECSYAAKLGGTEDPLDQSTHFAAELAGSSASVVKRHRRGHCACNGKTQTGKPVADAWPNVLPGFTKSTPSGESEMVNNLDGTANYSRFSDVAWGLEDFRTFIASKGQDPDKVTFTYGWTSNPAGGFWNKLNNVRLKPVELVEADFDEVDLPALYAAIESVEPRTRKTVKGRGTVIVYADPQTGKTGRRGGTKELIERSTIIRRKLDDHLSSRNRERILLADAGDGIEGFESGGNPMFTNDLSLTGQLDTYGTELFKFISVAHKHAPVTVAGVPSNHAAWRNGKQNLGRPSDDLGLFMHQQVANRIEGHGLDVEFVRPADYDESVAVDLIGTRIGLVHGNQFGPDKAVDWWQGQAFGAQAATTADVLVHGHYHSFSARVAGRNPVSERQRWCLGAPTLDNGSDWFRTVKGRDSDPGLLVFDVTEDGFDLGSLTIISA